jgi:hypothetical protein
VPRRKPRPTTSRVEFLDITGSPVVIFLLDKRNRDHPLTFVVRKRIANILDNVILVSGVAASLSNFKDLRVPSWDYY